MCMRLWAFMPVLLLPLCRASRTALDAATEAGAEHSAAAEGLRAELAHVRRQLQETQVHGRRPEVANVALDPVSDLCRCSACSVVVSANQLQQGGSAEQTQPQYV